MSDYTAKSILAIDTASSRLRLAVQFGGDRLVQVDEEVGSSHGQMLVRKIQDLLDSSGLHAYELEALVVGTGPGSFTGLRIGLAAAKGMAVALDIPVVGVSLLELAAEKLAPAAGRVAVVVPFKRGEVYLGWVEQGRCDLRDIRSVSTSSLVEQAGGAPTVGLGIELPQVLRPPDGFPPVISYSASDLLHLGVISLNKGTIPDLSLLEPLYAGRSTAEIRFDARRRGD